MKNLLKVVAMSAMMLSGMAVASGPTLYGKIHTSVDVMDNGGSSSDGDKYNDTSVNSNASRIGVKGSEDVGNGMKVGYLIEWEVDMDGDSNDMGVRNRAVTLSGDWGTALVGKWDTPMKVLGRKVDLFGDQVGDLRNMTNLDLRNLGGDNISTIDNRWDNVIQYASPDMSGFKVAVAYSTDTNTDEHIGGDVSSGDNQDNDGYSASAIYERGSYMVGLGYEHTDANGVSSYYTDDQKAWRIAGSYMPTADIDVVASYTDISNAGMIKNLDADIATIGASYKMGNNKLKLQYAVRDVDISGYSSGDDFDSDMITIGLDHTMSTRTTVYVAYSMTDNDDYSNATPWLSSHDSNAIGAVGEDADVLSLGIIHKF